MLLLHGPCLKETPPILVQSIHFRNQDVINPALPRASCGSHALGTPIGVAANMARAATAISGRPCKHCNPMNAISLRNCVSMCDTDHQPPHSLHHPCAEMKMAPPVQRRGGLDSQLSVPNRPPVNASSKCNKGAQLRCTMSTMLTCSDHLVTMMLPAFQPCDESSMKTTGRPNSL